jgi:hypothetical protein
MEYAQNEKGNGQKRYQGRLQISVDTLSRHVSITNKMDEKEVAQYKENSEAATYIQTQPSGQTDSFPNAPCIPLCR